MYDFDKIIIIVFVLAWLKKEIKYIYCFKNIYNLKNYLLIISLCEKVDNF